MSLIDHNDSRREMNDPAEGHFNITADGSPLPYVTSGIYVGGSGNLVCTAKDGSVATYYTVPSGATIAIRAIAVDASSTATHLTGQY